MSDYVVSVAYMTESGAPNYSVSNSERSVSTFDVGFANQIARSLNACAGLNPAKLAALLTAIDAESDAHDVWQECPDWPGVEFEAWMDARAVVTAALAELRGAAS